MSESNMELSQAKHVDIFGLKVEGSNTIIWMRDCFDIVLHGLGGGADAFPNVSYYPSDFLSYTPSNIRIERTPKYKLANLINMGRSGPCAQGTPSCEPRPIASAADFPLTRKRLLRGNRAWPEQDLAAIAASMWAPWPGYYVSPTMWVMIIETDDGPGAAAERASDHFDRPIRYMRGWGRNHTDCYVTERAIAGQPGDVER